MSEKKETPALKSANLQDLSDRVGRLERSFSIVCMDLEEIAKPDRGGLSTNTLLLIYLGFIAGFVIARGIYSRDDEDRKGRR